MKRRLLALVLALALLPCCLARAGGLSDDAMYLYSFDDGEFSLIGQALQIKVGTGRVLICAAAGVEDGALLAVTAPGYYEQVEHAVLLGDSGLAMLEVPGLEGGVTLAGETTEISLIHGLLSNGDAVYAWPEREAWAGENEITLTAREGLLPGAVLLNASDAVTGLVVASLGEGVGRYLAVSVEGIRSAILGDAQEVTLGNWSNTDPDALGELTPSSALVSAEVTVEDGFLNIAWEGNAGEKYRVIIIDEDNPYVNTILVTVDEEEEPVALGAALPGRTYDVWVVQVQSEDESPDVSYLSPVTVTVPATGPVTDHGFVSDGLWLAVDDVSVSYSDTQELPRSERLTAAILTEPDNRFYLQSVSHYEVEAEESHNMVIALFAPDGSVYPMLSGWVYSPDYMAHDAWHVDITDLVTSCVTYSGVQRGDYRLAFYIDGYLADSVAIPAE